MHNRISLNQLRQLVMENARKTQALYTKQEISTWDYIVGLGRQDQNNNCV